MKSRTSACAACGTADLISRAHRIATGADVSLPQARCYFQNPSEFRRMIRASGALRDPNKAAQLRELLSTECREKPNGI